MKPGGCSDASRIRHADCNLSPTGSSQDGKTNIRYTAVTFLWLESLLEGDELDADWCKLPEEHPVRAMWWFRISAVVFCIGIVWIFWLFI